MNLGKISHLFALAIISGLFSSGASATGPYDATFGGTSIRWSQLSDYAEYLGPVGSTNPAYTVGYTVYDYFGNAPQPDGTFDYEQYQDVVAQDASSIFLVTKYNPPSSVSAFVNPFNSNEVLRVGSNSSNEPGFLSMNINVLGNEFSIHKELTRVQVSSTTNSASPQNSHSRLELMYRISDTDPDPEGYEYLLDPTYNFFIPSVDRHINANAFNWYNNPGTFEVIDVATADREFTLLQAVVRINFDGVAIPNLTSIDLSDPVTSSLITLIIVDLYFEDIDTFYPKNVARLSVAYDMELASIVNEDLDEDGLADSADNCPSVANFDQANFDGVFNDGGDACDTDDDNDGVYDIEDNCPRLPNAGQVDSDNNGIGDSCQGLPPGC
ncbi:MAG: thrombospondin type 3 repeat-containing protein [Halioglobus sp.]|nr:thrombospondin type 3 repeat-containing protein [Halioglobus sp.]